ncbi:MAG: RraA family protein [Bacilli bacterium]|nr:RraA family protein [Bacilli bacterium]
MRFNSKEDIIALTPLWKGKRLPDGRPYVSDEYLKKLREMTLEEVWKPIYLKGYITQFEGNLKVLHHDGRKLIGRAVTCSYVPTRPDLHDVAFKQGALEGRKGNYNQWVVDTLVEGDVVVADMYDKIFKGTFLGGNLTTAIKTRTKTGGAVIWGGIRDLEQMVQVPDVQVYYRGIDPTPIREFIMKDFNSVTRIGKATVLPGDIVYGTEAGVLFIPSHLVVEVVDGAAKTHIKDEFGFEMIQKGKFTTAQIDKATWTVEMLDLLMDFIKKDPRGKKYRNLDWSEEYRLAKEGNPDDTQTAL